MICMRTTAFVVVLIGMLSSLPTEAITVQRANRSLKDVPTRLVVNSAVPATVLRSRSTGAESAKDGRNTQLTPNFQPSTMLRQAEVPPGRLELTRGLLSELKAIQTAHQAISIDLPSDVLFDFDKADLRPDAAGSLDKAAELIRSYPTAPLTVVGHTDARGTDAYNNALSLRRAQAVAVALHDRTDRQAQTMGKGRREPIAPNNASDGSDDPVGRQRNRRVQILLEFPSSPSAARRSELSAR